MKKTIKTLILEIIATVLIAITLICFVLAPTVLGYHPHYPQPNPFSSFAASGTSSGGIIIDHHNSSQFSQIAPLSQVLSIIGIVFVGIVLVFALIKLFAPLSKKLMIGFNITEIVLITIGLAFALGGTINEYQAHDNTPSSLTKNLVIILVPWAITMIMLCVTIYNINQDN